MNSALFVFCTPFSLRPADTNVLLRVTQRNGVIRRTTCALLLRDFTAGPEQPGVPRKLTRVVLFSSATGLLWYGWYKWCIEEELRLSGHGRGAVFALGPFTAFLGTAIVAPSDVAPLLGTLALAWIMSIQYSLHGRINKLYAQRGAPEPMLPHWVVVPGFNLVAGLRSLHFLAAHWAHERGDSDSDREPLADRFPFLNVPTLDALQLLRSYHCKYKLVNAPQFSLDMLLKTLGS